MSARPTRFRITIEAGRCPLGRTAEQRVRGLLKIALRGFALRAVKVEPAPPPEPRR